MIECRNMSEQEAVIIEKDEPVARVYEIGYHISPSVKEENLEKVVSGVRSTIEGAGGSFIAEGAPALTRLSYPLTSREGGKTVEYDRGYFGWIKFEAGVDAAEALEQSLKASAQIMRFIVFTTVREDTRAKIKPTLREVRRTDTIKMTPRRAEESAVPVSEEDLEKALLDITKE